MWQKRAGGGGGGRKDTNVFKINFFLYHLGNKDTRSILKFQEMQISQICTDDDVPNLTVGAPQINMWPSSRTTSCIRLKMRFSCYSSGSPGIQ